MKNPVRFVCGSLAIVALIICAVASLRVFFGSPTGTYEQDFAVYKVWFNWGTLLWFLTAPFWMVPELFQKQKDK